jgi:hypothetical protein
MFVYRIDTELTKEQSDKIVNSLSILEIERLESYNLKAFDIEVNGRVSSYIITDRYVLSRIIIFLRQKNIEFKYEDISEDVLIGYISFKETSFEDEVEEFIINNITLDNILDKINKFGIESLTDTDKKCLESF